ncbi:MAG: hypothetical protein HXY38_03750 [Chloroflexi bacterium]|nr:hypothetical protein [Chloroflexota bacterium]
MIKKFLQVLSLCAIFALSACGGAESAPAISPEEIAATAAAQAWMSVTQTAAAMPTATSVPPTFTPQPTHTLAPIAILPTLPPATVAVVATPTSECNQIPQLEPKGAQVNVEFYNESGGSANFAFGMNYANDKGECYTYSFTLGNGDMSPATVLAGCYWGYAWINTSEPSVARSGDKILCLSDPGIIYKIVITPERVDFK